MRNPRHGGLGALRPAASRCASISGFLPAVSAAVLAIYPRTSFPTPDEVLAMPQLARRMGRAKPSAIMAGRRKGQAAQVRRPRHHQLLDRRAQLPARRARLCRRARSAGEGQRPVRQQPRRRRAARRLPRAHRASRPDRLRHAPTCATGIGAKHVIYNLAEALLDEGDTIAFAAPYWTSYVDIAEIVQRQDRPAAVPGRAGLQAHPGAARRRAGEQAEGLPVQQPVQPDRHGLHARTRSTRWPTCS